MAHHRPVEPADGSGRAAPDTTDAHADDSVHASSTRPEIPTSPTSQIGQRVRRARLSRNLTQSELAKGDFSVSYISAVERGQIRPSLGALERLATRLQVPLSELLTAEH